MRITFSSGLLIGAIFLSACADFDKQKLGTATGAIIGGVAGNKLSSKNNRAIGTLAGVAVGAFVGNRVGKYLSDQDKKKTAEASAKTAETGRPNEFRTSKGETVSTTPAPIVATTQTTKPTTDNADCKTVRQTIVLQNGSKEVEDVRLCNGPDGWQPA